MENKLKFNRGARFIQYSQEWIVVKHYSNGNVRAIRVCDETLYTFTEDDLCNVDFIHVSK